MRNSSDCPECRQAAWKWGFPVAARRIPIFVRRNKYRRRLWEATVIVTLNERSLGLLPGNAC